MFCEFKLKMRAQRKRDGGAILRLRLGCSRDSIHPKGICREEQRIGLRRVVVDHRGAACEEGVAWIVPPLAIVGKAENLLRGVVNLQVATTDDMVVGAIILDAIGPHLSFGREKIGIAC